MGRWREAGELEQLELQLQDLALQEEEEVQEVELRVLREVEEEDAQICHHEVVGELVKVRWSREDAGLLESQSNVLRLVLDV